MPQELEGSGLHHPRVMSRSLPHLTPSTITSSLSHTLSFRRSLQHAHDLLAHDEYLAYDVPWQSGGSTQIPPLTGYEPKLIETKAIEPEDLEPTKFELDRNLGAGPYQTQERLMRSDFQNPITEDMDEFGKVVAEMSYIQSQMHSDYDSVESKVEKTVNHFGYQLHRGNLLHCYRREEQVQSVLKLISQKASC